MTARIYRPSPSPTQSGRGKSKQWVLAYEASEAGKIEPLMGYTASGDTIKHVRIAFDTLEAAEAFAQKNGLPYAVQPAHQSTVKRVSYPDNFRADRKTPWTH